MSQDETELSNEVLELAHLYENAPMGLCVTDTQHRYVRINQLLSDINGKAIEEHIGRTVQEVIPHIADQIVPMFQGVIDSAEPVVDHEVRGHTAAYPNEERIFLGNHYPLLSKSGEVRYVHTIVQDVTEQRRAELILKESNEELSARVEERTAELVDLSDQLRAEVVQRRRAEDTARAGEERLRRLIESTQIIPWEADATTWKFTYVGPQAALLGYPLRRWYEQDFWVDHIHSDDREAAVNFCMSQLPHGKNYEFEYRMIAADGKEVWLHDLVSVELSNGKPVLLRGFMIDITDQKLARIELARSEEAVREHREALARVQRTASLEQLAGAIAHELNQPLTGILSNAQAGELLIRKGDHERDEIAEILAEIVADTKRASDVIRNLRDLYREHTSDLTAVDINATVKDTLRLLSSEFIMQHVTLDRQLAEGLPEVKGNRIQIQQVLLNLITNGHEAMAGMDGARRLRIATERNGNEVVVSVADSGPGIDPDKIEMIFQPLATWKPGGTGMGLAISHSIVCAHGGRMWAENQPEGGALMSFSIPVLKGTP